MGIASLVLAIAAIVLSSLSFTTLGYLSIVGLVFSIAAIVLGGVSMAKKSFYGLGIAGLVVGIIAFVYSLIPAIIWLLALAAHAAASVAA